MKRIVRLTERDLARVVKRVIREQQEFTCSCPELKKYMATGLSQVFGQPSLVKGSWEMVDVDTVKFTLPNGETLVLNVTD